MVYSASAVQATVQYHDPQFFLKRQACFYAVQALQRAVGEQPHRLPPPLQADLSCGRPYRLAPPLLRRGPGALGRRGARRLSLGPVHVQPAEMAKVALVIWLAYSLAKKADKIKTFTVGFLPHLIVAGVFMLLCLKQPDFGSAVVLLLLTFTLLFIAGAKVGYILGAVHPRRGASAPRPQPAFASTATSATSRGCTWTSTGRISPISPSRA